MGHFDLREASADLGPFVRQDRRVLGAVLVFLLGFALLLVAASLPAIQDHHFSAVRIVELALLLGTALVGSAVLIPSILRRRQGATGLEVGLDGFELAYPDRKGTIVSWSDPALRFELMDLSGVNAGKLRSHFPYSITVRGGRSMLTREAFLALQQAIGQHRLLVVSTRGPGWVYSPDANPVIYKVRAPAS